MGVHFVLVLFVFLILMQFCCCSTNMSCTDIERGSLLKFKQGLTDKSNRLSSWVGNDCCAWHGVVCSKKKGRVIKLDLRNLGSLTADQIMDTGTSNYNEFTLGGAVNPSLVNLKHLNYLDLSMNNFSGAIPQFFGSFKDLRYLNLSCSGFSGKVPHHLGNLSSLQHLDLSNFVHSDDFSSGITYPSIFMTDNLQWVSSIFSLNYLDLSGMEGIGNDSNWLLSVNMLPSLKVLILDECSITSIPHLSRVNFTSLASLDLSLNYIDSSFPLWLSNITGLEHIYLLSNNFHGPIPDSLGMLNSLNVLDISGNSYNTSMPESLCNLSTLVYLDLSYNQFKGSLPSTIGRLTSLRELHIGDNQFSGRIPTSFGQLSNLRMLDMSNNHLVGSIPTNLGQLSRLEMLDVGNNPLDGNLSENHFTKLKMLEALDLSSTSLRLNVSLQWVPPFQLRNLNIGSLKNIGPRFPQWLQMQTHIKKLSIDNSGISDSIPDWFENFSPGIYFLDLSENQISGELPKLSRLLKFLLLSSNNLTGCIPTHICNIDGLRNLDLSNNMFSGRLPSCLGSLRYLKVLDVTNNSLHGRLPSSLGSLHNLQSLHLHNNMFRGNLPLFLQNLRALQTLSLGINSFRGTIPSWIGEKLSNLKILSLQWNLFIGEIPLQLCHLSALQVLDLAHNRLTGSIPTCVGNITGMIANHFANEENQGYFGENIYASTKGLVLLYTQSTIPFLTSIDLSDNNIVGEIPEGLMDLLGLKELNLSENLLNGRIPNTIGNLKQLESLDLSRNKLFGPIPPSLSVLNFLSFLNLSFNQLSGRIPTGNQLQTLDNPTIYEGNIALCGVPLMKSCSGNDGPQPANGREEGDESDHIWFYAGIGPGFLVGFLGICGVLHFNESFRHAYFQFFGNIFSWLALAIAVKIAWLQRKFHKR